MDQTATAVITDLRQTGTYINNMPQLEMGFAFYTDMGAEIRTREKLIVDYISISQFQVGAHIPIRYQGSNPENASYDKNLYMAGQQGYTA